MQVVLCILIQLRFIRMIKEVIDAGQPYLQCILFVSHIAAHQLKGKDIHLIGFFLRTVQAGFIDRGDLSVLYHSIHRPMGIESGKFQGREHCHRCRRTAEIIVFIGRAVLLDTSDTVFRGRHGECFA